MPAKTYPQPCPACEGEMWDNRENKKNPKAPDAKCKDKACGGVIWPPRNGKQTSAFQQAKQSMEHVPPYRPGIENEEGDRSPDEVPGIPHPPRNGPRQEPPKTAQNGKEGYWERKERRDLEKEPMIMRQHSQEMALRFFALSPDPKPPTTKQLRGMISWFQRDISRPPEKEPTEIPNEEGEYPF